MEPVVRFSVEITLISLSLWIVLVRARAAEHLANLGAMRIGALALFITAWLTIQLGDRLYRFYPQERSYFPVVRFAMYESGVPRETVPSSYIEGETTGGSSVRLDLTEWFPSVDPTALDNRLTLLAHWLQAEDSDDVERAQREIEGYVAGLADVLTDAEEAVPQRISLHATSHRTSDRSLVADTVVWSRVTGGPDR